MILLFGFYLFGFRFCLLAEFYETKKKDVESYETKKEDVESYEIKNRGL